MKPKKITQISFLLFLLFLISFPLSVSFSQTFFAFSLLFSLPSLIKQKKSNSNPFHLLYFPLVFWMAWGIYLGILISSILNWMIEPSLFHSLFLGRGEFWDIWMVFAIPLGIFHTHNRKKFKIIKRILLISFILCLVTGLVSVFSPYRLGKWIQYGFSYPEGERLQHFAGALWGRFTYLPIGLMNTHLTFGGIFSLLGFGVLFEIFRGIQWNWKNSIKIFLSLILMSLSIIVLVLNQSRSIWISVFFLSVLYFLFHLFLKQFKNRNNTNLTKKIFQLSNYRLTFPLIFGFVLIILLFQVLWDHNWLFQRTIQDLKNHKSTENQRYFIYKNSFQVLKQHLVVGIGNNQYSNQQKILANQIIQNKEWLWYELSITPRSHAHHDFLHFWIVGGILTAIVWILFWSLLFQKWFLSVHSNESSIALGVGILFIAGMFQCYQLDDEVALPFYTFVGFLFHKNKTQTLKTTYFSLSLALVSFLTFFSLVIYFFRTNSSPEEIYSPRVEINSSKNENIYRLDGCLTHNFGPPITIRKEPFFLLFEWEGNRNQLPQKIEIEVWDRDTFDQDKFYKAHKREKIKSFSHSMKLKSEWIQINNNLNVQESSEFPGKVRFRDFVVHYKSEDNSDLNLLKVRISRFCEKDIH
jgi:hypothetical protein